MDSSPKPPVSGLDPKTPAQPANATNPDATLRTTDGDVTIRTPDQPTVVPAGDVTVRLLNQPAAAPEINATVRIPNQPAARTMNAAPSQSAWWAKAAKPALAAVSLALVMSIGIYAFSLKSKVAMEVAQRQEVEAGFQQLTILAGALRQELTQAQQELTESKQRLSTMAALKDMVAQREMDIEQLRTQLEQKEKELVTLYKKASPKDEMLAMLQSANVRVLSLAGTNAAKSAGGLILYDPERGKVYQLWAITTKPVSAGTFIADTGRKSRYLARSLPAKAAIVKFTISIEPEGGRPQPTGAIYLHGSL